MHDKVLVVAGYIFISISLRPVSYQNTYSNMNSYFPTPSITTVTTYWITNATHHSITEDRDRLNCGAQPSVAYIMEVEYRSECNYIMHYTRQINKSKHTGIQSLKKSTHRDKIVSHPICGLSHRISYPTFARYTMLGLQGRVCVCHQKLFIPDKIVTTS